MKPMTDGEMENVVARSVGTPLAYGVAGLRLEIERLSDRLTDCWLLLDEIARKPNEFGARAAVLLVKQEVPGWKRS